jgi:hypothetical protein
MNAENKLKLVLFFESVPVYILVFGLCFACAFFYDKYIEAVLFLTGFFSLRYTFKKTYHSNSTAICLFITISMFLFGITISVSIRISLFLNILISLAMCFGLYHTQVYIDLKAENAMLKKEFELKSAKSLQEMTPEEFDSYCRHRGLNDMEVQIARKIYIDGLKGVELYSAIGYSVAQSKRIRKKIFDKLR